MSAYRVEFTTAAAKEVRKLEPQIRRRVLAAIANLETDPRPSGVRKLAGHESAWRVRIGDYRVLYEISNERVVVTVFRVAHRRAVYEDH
ncbi:type II toxin-antitoxin system RelE/ParE family toxin [Microbacterium sp. VKM Ac-2870]|uniref:type II toxin-antitoxin system RelE family toxin n=1 Tax=Microbacterium sp. VKM Ac-2870 TaxID=2783825 RepID=UPI00188CD356|nr:type II toxin-antitoxin system RelE/ParE family toxin [Microbacterium sp. VKM Ac-2870]MBF4563391.1 type II toxin-antitoxin system RelE/ParE family toxin [Microbacterium sp. VKM Ac-2870]